MKSMIKFFALVAVVVLSAVNCANQNKPVSSSASLQSIYFDFDMSTIRSDSVGAMQGNGSFLKGNANVSVTIEGNCDNRGTNEYNMALGHRRAEAAKDYLVNLGVSSSRLRTVSYGEEKPVCYSNDEGCWQRNRRADFRR